MNIYVALNDLNKYVLYIIIFDSITKKIHNEQQIIPNPRMN